MIKERHPWPWPIIEENTASGSNWWVATTPYAWLRGIGLYRSAGYCDRISPTALSLPRAVCLQWKFCWNTNPQDIEKIQETYLDRWGGQMTQIFRKFIRVVNCLAAESSDSEDIEGLVWKRVLLLATGVCGGGSNLDIAGPTNLFKIKLFWRMQHSAPCGVVLVLLKFLRQSSAGIPSLKELSQAVTLSSTI